MFIKLWVLLKFKPSLILLRVNILKRHSYRNLQTIRVNFLDIQNSTNPFCRKRCLEALTFCMYLINLYCYNS